jgi:hypothetical protein
MDGVMHSWMAGLAAAVILTASAAWAQTMAATTSQPFENPDPSRYLFEDGLRPGMKGYGLTVMHGGVIEKFQVEIIDVIKNMSPNMNTILVRCAGLNLEHTGIIAGMSGSPVFIDDKMIGAIAFGWDSSKDPIGGIQPIRQMLSIPLPTAKQSDEMFSAKWSGRWGPNDTSSLKSYAMQRAGWNHLVARMEGYGGKGMTSAGTRRGATGMGGLRPLAAPLMVAGASDSSFAFLQSSFSGTGLVPVASGSVGSSTDENGHLGGAAAVKPGEIKLEPGSSIAIPLLKGDLDLSAIGTVTEIYHGHVYAFGHAMEAEGPSQLPISTGYIFTIMPTLQQSFKMGASFAPAGSLVTDEQTGIVGKIGLQPRYVPVEIGVHSADGLQNHVFHFQLAVHPKYTPEILMTAVMEALTAQQKFPKEFTTRFTGTAEFDGASVPLDTVATNDTFSPDEALLPVGMLLDNPWKSLPLKSVKLDADIDLANHSIQIKSVSLDQTTVAPGQEITATVQLQPWHQAERKVELRIKIPQDTPDGDYPLAVGSTDLILSQETDAFPQRFAPESIGQLIHDVHHILEYRPDHIYAMLLLEAQGVAQSGREFQYLPRTRVAMFATDKRGEAQPVFNTSNASVPADGVVLSGGENFSITVDKDAGKRFFSNKPGRAALQKVRNLPLGPTQPVGSGTETQPQN